MTEYEEDERNRLAQSMSTMMAGNTRVGQLIELLVDYHMNGVSINDGDVGRLHRKLWAYVENYAVLANTIDVTAEDYAEAGIVTRFTKEGINIHG